MRYLDGVHPGNDELKQGYHTEIFPNPSKGFFRISNPHHIIINDLIITDSTGRLVFHTTGDSVTGMIDVSGLVNGVYFLHFGTDSMQIVKKLVIQGH
jgi:hypothetical protein